MSETKHTPTPWTVKHGEHESELFAEKYRGDIAAFNQYTGALEADECRANAARNGFTAESPPTEIPVRLADVMDCLLPAADPNKHLCSIADVLNPKAEKEG